MSHAAGEVVIEAGDRNDQRVFLLLSGGVSVLVDTKDGHLQRLATLCPGMIFGEMVRGQTVRTATIQADTGISRWVFTAAAFDASSLTHPQLKLALLDNPARLFAGNLRQANALIAALARFPAVPETRRWRDGKFSDRAATRPE